MNFSKIGRLGTLDKFTKDTLCMILSTYIITIVSQDDKFEIVRFCGDKTIMDVKFDKNGNFIKIIREEWEEMNLVFNYPLKNGPN
jgi:hypothetical protein